MPASLASTPLVTNSDHRSHNHRAGKHSGVGTLNGALLWIDRGLFGHHRLSRWFHDDSVFGGRLLLDGQVGLPLTSLFLDGRNLVTRFLDRGCLNHGRLRGDLLSDGSGAAGSCASCASCASSAGGDSCSTASVSGAVTSASGG